MNLTQMVPSLENLKWTEPLEPPAMSAESQELPWEDLEEVPQEIAVGVTKQETKEITDQLKHLMN